jgi:catechol 2,3-dioxygenase-like lactoylglutathione lyase family enzyme
MTIVEGVVLDHIGIGVSDYDRSRQFYIHALSALEIGVVLEVTAEQTGSDPACGFGSNNKPYFWIGPGPAARCHVAFTAQSRRDVDSFYKMALAAGGRDNGPPGIRAHYHTDYYGAFVLDPDGHNIEAVCHLPK